MIQLAKEIAVFPQTSMKNNRLSVYELFGMNKKDAIANEFKWGLKTLSSGEYLEGSKAFTQGKRKCGKFND